METLTTTLFLIRHGEAYANVDPGGAVAGMRGDRGLTELGRAQAQRLRDRVAAGEMRADVFIASTLPRARQTAEILAPAIGLPIVWDDEVQEVRPGEADGMGWREMQETYGVPDFRRYPYRPLSTGGENWPQFVLRVATALDRIASEHEGKTVVIVTHGGFIDATFLVHFGVGMLAPPPLEFYTHNTAITQWERTAHEGASPRWRLVRYNDDVHVRDIVVDERFRWRKLFAEAREGAEAPAAPLPTEPLEETAE